MNDLRKFGPRPKDAPQGRCEACKKDFKEDEYTTLISLGPGNDPEAMRKVREGSAYNAIAIEIHYSCATGNN